MKLSAYIESNKLTHTEVADACGTSVSTITRAADGKTIPSRELMDKLFEFTGGLVTPNDFYDLGAAPDGTVASEAA